MDLSAVLFAITQKCIVGDLFDFQKDRLRYFLDKQIKYPLPWKCQLHNVIIDVASDLRVKAGVFRRYLPRQRDIRAVRSKWDRDKG